MKRIIKVLLSSIFCLSTLAGCSSSPYTKAEAQTLTIQGVPVYVEPDEETIQNDIDLYLKAIAAQPEYLMRNCTGIHLQGKNNYLEQAKTHGHNYDWTAGYESGEEIYLNVKTDYVFSKITDDTIEENVSHELWHVFDYANGNDEYYLSEFDFNILYNQNPGSISEYGATNVLEFFAEAGSMYINNPEELEQKNIDVYNYFELLPKE